MNFTGTEFTQSGYRETMQLPFHPPVGAVDTANVVYDIEPRVTESGSSGFDTRNYNITYGVY